MTFPCKIAQENGALKRTHEAIGSSNPKNIEKEPIENENVGKPRRSKRTKISKSLGPAFLTYLLENKP